MWQCQADVQTEGRQSYPIRLSSHMERPALELTEVFEEDGYKGSDILGAVLGRVLIILIKV